MEIIFAIWAGIHSNYWILYQILPESPDEVYRTIPGKRNSARYSPYSRLDLGFVYHTKFFGSKMDIYVQIINVFNRKNIFRKSYNVENILKLAQKNRQFSKWEISKKKLTKSKKLSIK